VSPQINANTVWTSPSYVQTLINQTLGPVTFIAPTLTNGNNRLLVSVSCTNGGWSAFGLDFNVFVDLLNVTTNTAIVGDTQGNANPPTLVNQTTITGGTAWGFAISDLFAPPAAGNNIQIRLWISTVGTPSPQPILGNGACVVSVTPVTAL
jgi:hypothetical protein